MPANWTAGGLVGFDERLRRALSTPGARCAVLAVGLDAGADEPAAADALGRQLRGCDAMAYFGPGRFLICLADLSDDEAAAESARAMLHALRANASIGVAAAYPGATPGTLIAAADREMSAVKRNGGNGIKLASPWPARSSQGPRPFAILESA